MPEVTLCDILEYVEGGSRCIKEGEAVFNAGHIIMCGINNQKKEEIIGLCVQTSNLKVHPHTIKINLDTPKQWMCTCTYKAGARGKCKHIIACLLFIYRYFVYRNWKRKDNVSCEDVVPIKEFCHVKKRKVPNAIDQEIVKLTYEELLFLPLLNIKQQEYFNNYVAVTIDEAINISLQTIGQGNDQWKRARQCRITASTCYELYILLE
ncbi:hypothetical protein RN001_005799 [Aquatica leii]|uniref:SWIM-type domain-containing protein n=1 Tax=Aquatica leii TaxID=1421715 RepID=A0AAN7SS48_9COLE|nr:hypothetical protein RN001_005799 [Aquatica leii]